MNSHKPISCSLLIMGFFCLSGLLLFPTIGRGQEITGKIIDGENAGIPFANIVLLSRDSTFIKGTTTAADGSFMINKAKNAAILRVSSIGYSTTYLDIAEKEITKISVK
ncbi:carboxypeptidase-like regulatory domain-containing protein [Prevotella sp. KH2C16]|uniref:carboxypeptidase-like regulatory domain-containing protein n=1 Tax=Prevotella sp. KH2C16 TaxID=1855325 RepID=UPI0008E4DECD|nr:carboxypeptidase-like regulatory domain-containing protein [Prevotella sp. KH2C16]SFG23130.1 CarboxypepD_reg-like domain-containing protein [Prevotella sp. KH2C16]